MKEEEDIKYIFMSIFIEDFVGIMDRPPLLLSTGYSGFDRGRAATRLRAIK